MSGSAPIIVTPTSSPTSSSSGSPCESPELPHLPHHKYPQPPPIISRDSGDSLENLATTTLMYRPTMFGTTTKMTYWVLPFEIVEYCMNTFSLSNSPLPCENLSRAGRSWKQACLCNVCPWIASGFCKLTWIIYLHIYLSISKYTEAIAESAKWTSPSIVLTRVWPMLILFPAHLWNSLLAH